LIWFNASPYSGAFSKSVTWTVETAGQYTLCGYVSGGGTFDPPDASTSVGVAVRPPAGTLTLDVSGNNTPTAPIAVRAFGSIDTASFLYVAAAPRSACGATALATAPDSKSDERRIIWPYLDTTVGPGLFEQAGTLNVMPATSLTICGYVAGRAYDSAPYVAASRPIITCCAPSVPVLRPVARPVFGSPIKFEWDSGYATTQTVSVYGSDPALGASIPLAKLESKFVEGRGPLLELENFVSLRRVLVPGTYFWRVDRDSGDWPAVSSAAAAFTIPKPPVGRLRADAFVEGYRRVTAKITAVATPFTNVTVTVRRDAQLVLSKRYEQRTRVGSAAAVPTSFTVRGSCQRPGTYRYVITARDARGQTRSKRGRWDVASCAEVTAWEREAAREEAQKLTKRKRFVKNCLRRGGIVRDGRCVNRYGVIIIIF
jgi:hypothetical protein